MNDSQVSFELNRLQQEMKLTHYQIRCERISIHQVCDDECKRGHEFVGIHTDHTNGTACLYHTRNLHLDDLIHELLHVKYPLWTEEEINTQTAIMMLEKEVKKSEIL